MMIRVYHKKYKLLNRNIFKVLKINILTALLSIVPMYFFAQDAGASGNFATDSCTVDSTSLNYVLFSPGNIDPAKKYPLILGLHGAECILLPFNIFRNQLQSVILGWTKPLVQEKYPCFVVAPQAVFGKHWDKDETKEVTDSILNKIISSNPIDTNRIYVTGHSMGGEGVLQAYLHNRNRFAALMPISAIGGRLNGKLIPNQLTEINDGVFDHIAIWGFHSKNDRDTPISTQLCFFNNLQDYNSDVHFVKYNSQHKPDADLQSLIAQRQKHLFSEYSFRSSDIVKSHTNTMDSTVVDTMVHKWLFNQYKIDKEAIKIQGINKQNNWQLNWQCKNPNDTVEIWGKQNEGWFLIEKSVLPDGFLQLSDKLSAEKKQDISLKIVVINQEGFVYGIDKLNVSSTVAAINLFEESEYRAYPNPTSGKVFISSRDNNVDLVEVFDQTGALADRYHPSGDKVFSLDLSDKPNGIYILKIRAKRKAIMRKIIKR